MVMISIVVIAKCMIDTAEGVAVCWSTLPRESVMKEDWNGDASHCQRRLLLLCIIPTASSVLRFDVVKLSRSDAARCHHHPAVLVALPQVLLAHLLQLVAPVLEPHLHLGGPSAPAAGWVTFLRGIGCRCMDEPPHLGGPQSEAGS